MGYLNKETRVLQISKLNKVYTQSNKDKWLFSRQSIDLPYELTYISTYKRMRQTGNDQRVGLFSLYVSRKF